MDERHIPQKPNLLLRLLAFLVTVALVAGAIFLIANRDRLNLDSLKRYITYRSLERSDSGQAESFPYSGSSTDVFAALGDDLLVCSSGGVRLYSGGGVRYVEDAILLEEPVAHVCEGRAAVYSAGGDSIYLYRDRLCYGSLTELEGSILSVRLNSAGWLAVTTRDSGYRAVVTVYDDKLQKLLSFRLSSVLATDAVVTADCASLAVLSIGQEGTSFESALSFYPLPDVQESGVEYGLEPSSSFSLGNNVILDLYGGEAIWCVGDAGVSIWSGGEAAHWSYPEEHLKAFAFGDGFAAVLVGKYRSGSQAELITVDAAGVPSDTLAIGEQVLSLSAAGRYVAVLTAGRLDIYTRDLTLYDTLQGTNGASRVLMRGDGTALLIGSESAQLYIPN